MQKIRNILLNKPCIIVPLMEDRIGEDSLEEFEIIVKTDNFVITKGFLHQVNSLCPCAAISYQLGNHWVIEC